MNASHSARGLRPLNHLSHKSTVQTSISFKIKELWLLTPHVSGANHHVRIDQRPVRDSDNTPSAGANRRKLILSDPVKDSNMPSPWQHKCAEISLYLYCTRLRAVAIQCGYTR